MLKVHDTTLLGRCGFLRVDLERGERKCWAAPNFRKDFARAAPRSTMPAAVALIRGRLRQFKIQWE